jgi:hypothetical protein
MTRSPYLSYGDQYHVIFLEKSAQLDIMYIVRPSINPTKIDIMNKSKTEDLSFLVSIAPLQQTYIPNATTHRKSTAGLNVEKN